MGPGQTGFLLRTVPMGNRTDWSSDYVKSIAEDKRAIFGWVPTAGLVAL